MAIDFEKLIVDSLITGVSKSSMLASSLAVRIAQDQRFVRLIIESIDYEIMAKYLAKEILRRGSSRQYGISYTAFIKTVEKEARELLIREMALELNLPNNAYKKRSE